MDQQLQIVALVGSLRRESYTRRVVNVLRELAPTTMAIEIAPIGSLPLYNEDEETEAPPTAWQRTLHCSSAHASWKTFFARSTATVVAFISDSSWLR